MPAKDLYHQLVKQLLIDDGWTITHDPFPLQWARRNLSIDLGAEKLIAAQKAESKIAVEIKSFLRESRVADLQQALGQYILYNDILKQIDPDRILYLAMPLAAYSDLFEKDQFGKILLENDRLKLIIFDSQNQEVTQWIL
ncbi:MAG: fatty-acid synthase [Symploca sp. SIO1C2]|nr:fatty-acid synthase [Symploca sp. SIO1C2]